VYADQIEWMHRNLENRRSIILSVHPHNDRGTAVASAELALMAGADRVEGTLFGNGERTGNVCLVTLALNLFSSGVDPQLDLSDIDGIRSVVESANQLPVHARYPYAGDLVYTAFSGTHQDAIAKGFAALEERSRRAAQPAGELPWDVPYLPIDPRDVGRTYESVVRVNSQSGKGGVAHVLNRHYGLDLPRGLRIEFAKTVQRITDNRGAEINSRELWGLFKNEYLQPPNRYLIKEFQEEREDVLVRLEALIVLADGSETRLAGAGDTVACAVAAGLADAGYPLLLRSSAAHPVADSAGTCTACYAEVALGKTTAWGAGLDPSAARAELDAVISAVSRAVASKSA
jgi:2-isopropylmalate synthase